jgi:26S proteasome regulatory subunit N9
MITLKALLYLPPQPALANNNDYVKSKVTLLCLINLFFQRPAHDRNVPFSDISEATRLPVEEVQTHH